MVTADERDLQAVAGRWTGLLATGAWAALASVALIVVQVAIYLAWPPPVNTVDFFELLIENPLLGVIALDALYIVSNLLAFLLYLALAVALWRVSRSAVVVAKASD